jgi:hypothetical protein
MCPKSLHALLEHLIDYAGTAPPAALSMSAAMHNYVAYAGSEYAWMLGRFVLPLAGLAEFENLAAEAAANPSLLSVTAVANDIAGMQEVVAFNHRAAAFRSPVQIDTVEVKAESEADIRQTMAIKPEGVTVYFEIAPGQDYKKLFAAIAETGGRAKIRTGGVTTQMFPPVEEVACFIHECARAKIAFKATAGLHHPIRSVRPFTPQPGSESGIMHGFVNVFLAAAQIYCGLNEAGAMATLEERSPEVFHLEDDGMYWHGWSLNTDLIQKARKEFAISLGSCSFVEPVEDLRGLGWL